MSEGDRSFLFRTFYSFFLKSFEKDMQDYKDDLNKIEKELERRMPIASERDLQIRRTAIQRRMMRFGNEKNSILENVTNRFIDNNDFTGDIETILMNQTEIQQQIHEFWVGYKELVENFEDE